MNDRDMRDLNTDEQPGEYTMAGEDQGIASEFTAQQVADGFGVDISRVHEAFKGEYDLGEDGQIDSKQAQRLAELFFADRPLDIQQAALMKLGAFTPRYDSSEPSVSEKAPGELSDKISPEQGYDSDLTD